MAAGMLTGAWGFSGNCLVKGMVKRGSKVRASDLESDFGRPKERELRKTPDLDRRRDGMERLPYDLTRPETFSPLFQKEEGCLFPTASFYGYPAS